ncbi:MAG TPA: rRNA maturation RNase YbeY [Dehalococcoidia bacterium]|nr:rRNA maturation RNase YbeY [Dehalococcoidia bacterium]
MAREIGVIIDEGFAGCPEADWLRGIAEQVLIAEGVGPDVELGLVITTQEKVRELNRTYRGEDRATDVLAFYLTSPDKEADFVSPPDGVVRLGEVIISYPQAVVQAQEQQHSVEKELIILIIHGVLHLLGYDHEAPEDERRMRAREREILNRIEAGLVS